MKNGLTDVGLLILRVVLGVTMAIHGVAKFGNIDGFAKALEGMNVPLPVVSAWLAALAESGGGVLLIAGILPRFAAAAIGFTMVVAILKKHLAHGFFMNHFNELGKEHGYEFCLNLLAMALTIVLAGGGKYVLEGYLPFLSKKKASSSE